MNITTGAKIKKVRKEKKLTQKEFAFKLNKTVSLVQKYENDERNIPLKAIIDIASVLNVNPRDLIGDATQLEKEYLVFEDILLNKLDTTILDKKIEYENKIFIQCVHKLYNHAGGKDELIINDETFLSDLVNDVCEFIRYKIHIKEKSKQ